MRFIYLFLLAISFVVISGAPQSKLQFDNVVSNGKPVIEEVVVESTLHIRSPSANRQARTNVRTNLQDGTRVAELKSN